MIGSENYWVGADPGGNEGFGISILRIDGSTQTWLVDFADEAVDKVREQCAAAPKGVGVDAPLWWSSGKSSDRRADQWLRKTYGLSGGQVQAVNSLRGAALVQAAMFVDRLRGLFPEVPVTETHPKAVLKALRLGEDAFGKRFSVRLHGSSEDERDAVISAVAAREGFEGRWMRDLTVEPRRGPSEQDPASYWLAPVHYFWPE